MGRLIARPHVSALVGLAGRRWLAELELPTEERETLEGCMRQIEFLDEEIAALERVIARAALESAEIRRLLSVPGVNVIGAPYRFWADSIRPAPTGRVTPPGTAITAVGIAGP